MKRGLMEFGKASFSALVAISLVSAPTLAVAQNTSDSAGSSSSNTAFTWGLAALFAGLIAVIVISKDDDDEPVSP